MTKTSSSSTSATEVLLRANKITKNLADSRPSVKFPSICAKGKFTRSLAPTVQANQRWPIYSLATCRPPRVLSL